jgi:hypothetical protein
METKKNKKTKPVINLTIDHLVGQINLQVFPDNQDISSELRRQIYSAEGYLYEVFLNALSNAIATIGKAEDKADPEDKTQQ